MRALCIGSIDEPHGIRYADNDACMFAAFLRNHGWEVVLYHRIPDVLTVAQYDMLYYAGHATTTELRPTGYEYDGALHIEHVGRFFRFAVLECCHAGRSLATEGTCQVWAAAEWHAFESKMCFSGEGGGLFTEAILGEYRASNLDFDLAASPFWEMIRDNVSRQTGGWQKPVRGWL